MAAAAGEESRGRTETESERAQHIACQSRCGNHTAAVQGTGITRSMRRNDKKSSVSQLADRCVCGEDGTIDAQTTGKTKSTALPQTAGNDTSRTAKKKEGARATGLVTTAA